MCEELIENGVKYLHFYTLNLEKSVIDIIHNLKIERKQRKLPWRKPSFKAWADETVRPIFWSNKQMSYIAWTNDWDEFPNGRWGVSRSPAFGDITDYPSMSKYVTSQEKHIKMWGELKSEKDFGSVILKYISGEIKRLPWSETSIAKETGYINDFVKLMNEKSFFTTNS